MWTQTKSFRLVKWTFQLNNLHHADDDDASTDHMTCVCVCVCACVCVCVCGSHTDTLFSPNFIEKTTEDVCYLWPWTVTVRRNQPAAATKKHMKKKTGAAVTQMQSDDTIHLKPNSIHFFCDCKSFISYWIHNNQRHNQPSALRSCWASIRHDRQTSTSYLLTPLWTVDSCSCTGEDHLNLCDIITCCDQHTWRKHKPNMVSYKMIWRHWDMNTHSSRTHTHAHTHTHTPNNCAEPL